MSAALSSSVAEILARYRLEMRDFDAREQKYKPRWQITPTGSALLLHREIEHQNPARVVDAADAEGGDA